MRRSSVSGARPTSRRSRPFARNHQSLMFSLAGKVALVTGASRGIGRAIAARLAQQGATVVAAARGDHAAECVSELRAAGHLAEALMLDVTDAAAVQTAPAEI